VFHNSDHFKMTKCRLECFFAKRVIWALPAFRTSKSSSPEHFRQYTSFSSGFSSSLTMSSTSSLESQPKQRDGRLKAKTASLSPLVPDLVLWLSVISEKSTEPI